MKANIPELNLDIWNLEKSIQRKSFIDAVGSSLRDVGFFCLKNHGVDIVNIQRAYELSQEFFEFSSTYKNRFNTSTNSQRGYTGFGVEHAKNNKKPDLKEFFHVGQELLSSHQYYNIYPQNIWPDQAEFKEVFLKMYSELEQCSIKILQACSLFLQKDINFFSDMIKDGNSILRIIHYPALSSGDIPEGALRAAEHEDINFITLLCAASAEGLELLQKNGDWLAVNAAKEDIIVDAGDMLQNITNGYFKSTTHRVVNPQDFSKPRFSMPFFAHPRADVSLTPLESSKIKGGTKYQNITAGDFLNQRLQEIGLMR